MHENQKTPIANRENILTLLRNVKGRTTSRAGGRLPVPCAAPQTGGSGRRKPVPENQRVTDY